MTPDLPSLPGTKIITSKLNPPPGCPDYMAMNHAVMGNPIPNSTEVRGIIPEKRKVPKGWPVCLKRSPPKVTFQNNDIYSRSSNSRENIYEEPEEKKIQEGSAPKEKNMRIFFMLDINENTDITSTPHEEKFDEHNYKSIEEHETTL